MLQMLPQGVIFIITESVRPTERVPSPWLMMDSGGGTFSTGRISKRATASQGGRPEWTPRPRGGRSRNFLFHNLGFPSSPDPSWWKKYFPSRDMSHAFKVFQYGGGRNPWPH